MGKRRMLIGFVGLGVALACGLPAGARTTTTTTVPVAPAGVAECALGSGQDFHNQDLIQKNFDGQDLRCANFTNADLGQADFNGAILSRAVFDDADLGQAGLKGANLTEASLKRAKLIQAHLESALLVRADLGGADFTQAYTQGTDFTDATGYVGKFETTGTEENICILIGIGVGFLWLLASIRATAKARKKRWIPTILGPAIGGFGAFLIPFAIAHFLHGPSKFSCSGSNCPSGFIVAMVSIFGGIGALLVGGFVTAFGRSSSGFVSPATFAAAAAASAAPTWDVPDFPNGPPQSGSGLIT